MTAISLVSSLFDQFLVRTLIRIVSLSVVTNSIATASSVRVPSTNPDTIRGQYVDVQSGEDSVYHLPVTTPNFLPIPWAVSAVNFPSLDEK